MLKWFLTRALDANRKALGGVEMDWAYRLRDVAPWQLLRFSLIKTVEGPRRITPPSVYHAAGLAAAMVEDCGPCVQIHVNLALKDSVDAHSLEALLRRDFARCEAEAALAFQFGDAVARGEDASELRDQIAARWGERGVIELSFTIATARFYPAVKRGMGYARACEKIKIGSTETYAHKAA